MFFRNHDQKSFMGVAMATILIGAAVFAFGVVCWIANIGVGQTIFALPSAKIIGGLVIMSLGYIQLELELLRRK